MKRQLLAMACVMGGLAALADVSAPSIVTNEATLWLDASTLGAAAGTQLDTWQDVRGGGYKTATSCSNVKPQVIEIAEGDLAGKKAVTFFTVGTKCDMSFTRHQIRTAFLVCDLDFSDNAYLLGDTSNYAFARGIADNNGTVGSYSYGAGDCANVKYWCDGSTVHNPKSTLMPTGYHQFTYFNDSKYISKICQDRNIAARIGGKRLCEVITFSRQLSVVERSQIEIYLRHKWFGSNESLLDFIGNKAQVRFDASNADSFHYEGEGDEEHVVQWDDISGNNRHFKPYHTVANDPKFGTRGLVNGLWAYKTGNVSSRIDMQLDTRITNTRSFFIVCDIAKDGKVYWLGDASTWHFARGEEAQYLHPHNDTNIRYGTVNHNGVRVGDPLVELPDEPGGSSVYSMVSSRDCCWQMLGTDRKGSTRNGGKQVSEMMTFDEQMSEADRAVVDALLIEKWSLKGEALDNFLATSVVHVDAAGTNQFIYGEGTIDGWKNTGTGDDLFRPLELLRDKKPTIPAVSGTRDYTNGVPAFLMGPQGSDIELVFGLYSNIRTVFWAMDIERNSDVFFLGCGWYGTTKPGYYDFCRGLHAPFAYAASAYNNNFKNSSFACDGVYVTPTAATPPMGMHIYDMTADGNLTASSLSQDRWCTCEENKSIIRNGGRSLSELIIFTSPVTGLTRDTIRAYLQNKWTRNCAWAGAGDDEWGAGKYRVFNGDVEVPAEGASADGIGFTADATITGGALTLGKGGIFVAEGVTVMLSAPIANSELGIYGPGTVIVDTDLSGLATLHTGGGNTVVFDELDSIVLNLHWNKTGDYPTTLSFPMPENPTRFTFTNVTGGKEHAFALAEGMVPEGMVCDNYLNAAGGVVFDFRSPDEQPHFFADAAVWVDAAKADTFTIENGNVTAWRSRANAEVTLTPSPAILAGNVSVTRYGARALTNGVPALVTGEAGSGIDLAFGNVSGVRHVFMAVDIQRCLDAFFLGNNISRHTVPDYPFCRGLGGQYAYNNDISLGKGTVRVDGTAVASVLENYPPSGLHVLQFNVSADPATVNCLSQDRNCSGRNGGRALSELLIFNTALSSQQCEIIENYLRDKWLHPQNWVETDTESGVLRSTDAATVIPAEGAALDGIALQEGGTSQTVSGGTITLTGDIDVFAAEDNTSNTAFATVSAPVTATGTTVKLGQGKWRQNTDSTFDDLVVRRGFFTIVGNHAFTANTVTLAPEFLATDTTDATGRVWFEIASGSSARMKRLNFATRGTGYVNCSATFIIDADGDFDKVGNGYYGGAVTFDTDGHDVTLWKRSSATLTKTGAGKLTIASSNPSGTITAQAGTLAFANEYIGNQPLVIASGATLAVDTARPLICSNAVTVAEGAVVKLTDRTHGVTELVRASGAITMNGEVRSMDNKKLIPILSTEDGFNILSVKLTGLTIFIR